MSSSLRIPLIFLFLWSSAYIAIEICSTHVEPATSALFVLPTALAFETMQISWNLNFVLGLSWLIVFVSIGAMSLLMTLIKNGEAGSVANLFYLVTPLVAVQAPGYCSVTR